jgi:hypothetical protein
MAGKGLGRGLDSLIPDFYDEDFDSNSPQSLEDLLKEDEVEEVEPTETDKPEETKNIFEELKEEKDDKEGSDDSVQSEEAEVDQGEPEVLPSDVGSEESVPDSQEAQRQKEHVAEVKEIVDKNPRITLWSSRSSAVFRYLRKTEPEFSISREASILIDEAVSKKYPEIWALFDDY